MVCMPALSFYLSYPCCGTGNFRKKAKDKASFTYLGRNNKSSRRMVSLEQCWSCLILAGVFLLQVPNMRQMKLETMALTLIPILIAAFSYPLGNRKVMSLVSSDISTLERVYAMTLCSLPVWIFLSIWAFITHGLPGRDQLIQSFFVALFSGTAATVLFFKATDMVKHNHKWLAVIEATQSGEVIFTLLGGILFLKDPVPSAIGLAGIAIIVAGMTGNSLCQ